MEPNTGWVGVMSFQIRNDGTWVTGPGRMQFSDRWNGSQNFYAGSTTQVQVWVRPSDGHLWVYYDWGQWVDLGFGTCFGNTIVWDGYMMTFGAPTTIK
jgi:hypothetical protein